MKKAIIIILIIIAGFILWKREPWVKTFSDKQECEYSTSKSCVAYYCDFVITADWLDCPHGSSFFAPIK